VTVADTWWNGEPTRCERVVVKVGKAQPGWWCASLEGTERDAVAVYYFPVGPMFLYDGDWPPDGPLATGAGSAWEKVTVGKGLPNLGHMSLPDGSEIVRTR
jgi:hypothetical protein